MNQLNVLSIRVQYYDIAQSLLLTFFILLLRFSKFIENPPDV